MTRAQPYEPEATVVESLPPSDDATSRATITRAVKAMFPGGRI